MADELRINASMAYEDSELTEDSLSIANLDVDVSTKRTAHLKQNVGTSEEVLNLGDISSLGYILAVNRSSSNFVSIKTAAGGTIFAKILPGEVAMFRFGSGVTAPFVIADTAACQLEYLLVSE